MKPQQNNMSDDAFRSYQREIFRFKRAAHFDTATNSTQQQQEANEIRKPISHAQFKSTLLQYAFVNDLASKKTVPEDYDAFNMLYSNALGDSVSNSVQLLKQRCLKMKTTSPIALSVTKDDLIKQPPFNLLLQNRAIPEKKATVVPVVEAATSNASRLKFQPLGPPKPQTRSIEIQTDPLPEPQSSRQVYTRNTAVQQSYNGDNNAHDRDNESHSEDEDVEEIKPENPFKTALQLSSSKKEQNKAPPPPATNRSSYNPDFRSNPVMHGIKKALDADKKNANKQSATTSKKRKFVPPRSIHEVENSKNETAQQPANKKQKTNNGSANGQKPDEENQVSGALSVFPNGEIPPELQHLDSKLIESICHDILEQDSGIGWDDIAGLEGPKRTIYEIIILPLRRPDLFYGARGPPKGVLLFGPPGTGKTLIAKAVATESKFTFFSISASSLTSKWIGEGERLVKTLFAIARYLQPSVIFIDEIDSLLSQRSDSDDENGTRRIKTEFLIQLDGAKTDGADRLLIIGATNLPQTIDEAVRRRLVKRIYIPLPDRPARLSLLKRTLDKSRITYTLSDDDMEKILDRTEGYSGSDLAAFVTDAAWGPVRELSHSRLASIDPSDVRPVQLKDFKKACNNIRASVNMEEVKKFEAWDEQFGCRYSTDEKDSQSDGD